MVDYKNLLHKFIVRQRLFLTIIESGITILAKDGENYYHYCDTEKVPELAKSDLATILADMTFNCPIKIVIGE